MWKKRYPKFALFLISASAASGLLRFCQAAPESAPQLPFICSSAEACYALGIPLPLKDADEFALQLVPKVGDSVSQSILEKRREICMAAAKLRSDESWKAFQLAKGVGPALAKELGQFLEVSPYSVCLP